MSSEVNEVSEAINHPLRLGVLLSGSGSNLQAIIDAIEQRQLPGVEIALVVSNKPAAQGVQRALQHSLPVIYLPWERPSSRALVEITKSEATLTALLHLFRVDLIVLAGWMRIFSAAFLAQFPLQIINLHPALLPDDGTSETFTASDGTVLPVFRGLHVVRKALDAGVHITGSSVHYVTPAVDAGPVICRAEIPIEPGESEEHLHERIKEKEHQLIIEAIKLYNLNRH